jgi:hypothetical protein
VCSNGLAKGVYDFVGTKSLQHFGQLLHTAPYPVSIAESPPARRPSLLFLPFFLQLKDYLENSISRLNTCEKLEKLEKLVEVL